MHGLGLPGVIGALLCALAGTVLLVLARRSPTPASPAADTAAAREELADAAAVGDLPEGGLALLLFAAAACPRCEDTREVLAAVAAGRPAVRPREVDVAVRPALTTSLGVRTTPTVVVVSATGTELLRVAGVPRRDDLVAALAPHLP